MRQIRLTGREHCVLKAIGFTEPVAGSEIHQHTQLQADDLADTLNALLAAGYVESHPYREQVESGDIEQMAFEVNPGYAHELKSALLKPWS